MAPQVEFEPTTLRLTAECPTIELLRSLSEEGELAVRRPRRVHGARLATDAQWQDQRVFSRHSPCSRAGRAVDIPLRALYILYNECDSNGTAKRTGSTNGSTVASHSRRRHSFSMIPRQSSARIASWLANRGGTLSEPWRGRCCWSSTFMARRTTMA